ncbi:MAG: methylated-DNA--[protein]-cysteine S-methyltransferase, partial [Candidatus Riflebacteria bacterium]|nr:methylated-DNA--[protein]-cysteine S-methyltransferase [Candidatus Riflebacteria bacterium]
SKALSMGATPDSPPGRVAAAITQIQKYFAGEEYDFRKIKIDPGDLPPFRRRLYNELQKVGHGCTVSYKALAEMCEKPGGARAVGMAAGANPLPLLIPCHRIVNADGGLGGFSAAGGVELKARMLRHEGLCVLENQPFRLCQPALLSDIDISSAITCLSESDADLGRFISMAPAFNLRCDNLSSPFQALLEAIVYQQLTGKAAATIFSRLLRLFSDGTSVTPLDIIRASDEELRSAGLSGAKVAAIRDLAEFAASGRLPELKHLQRMSDREIITRLSQIRGIGRWTVEMLLIFKLGRVDVMAADDYGLRKGLAVIRGAQTLPDAKELAREALRWRPFRSIAAWYLWRASEAAKLKAGQVLSLS